MALKILGPAASSPQEAATRADVLDVSPKVLLGSSWSSMDGLWPVAHATDGPLISDSAITASAPSPTTGLKFVPASEVGAFNYQSMNMIAASASRNPSGTPALYNAPTPRTYGFGTLSAEQIGGNMDIGFVTDSTVVIPLWGIFNAYDSVVNHDMHWCVSHRGQMKQLTALPKTSTGGGGVFHRKAVWKEGWTQEHRLFIPGRGYFFGVYIDTLASIRASANTQFFLLNGDSWNEPLDGCFKNERAHTGYPAGSYMTMGISERLSIMTGQRFATIAQGGSGWFNDGGGGAGALSATGTGTTCNWSVSRTDDFITKYAAKNPIVVDVGGWNDGNLAGTPYKDNYKTRLVAAYNQVLAAKPDLKFIHCGIQPVDISGGDARDLSMQAQAEIPAAFPDNCLGYISLKEMWTDTSASGPRSVYCVPEFTGFFNLYIHHTVGGKDNFAGWVLPRIAKMQCDSEYINSMFPA